MRVIYHNLALYKLATKSKGHSTFSDRVNHIGDKVDRINNKVDWVGNHVDSDKLSNSRCCRFVAKTGNKVDRIGNSQLCRQFWQQWTLSPVCTALYTYYMQPWKQLFLLLQQYVTECHMASRLRCSNAALRCVCSLTYMCLDNDPHTTQWCLSYCILKSFLLLTYLPLMQLSRHPPRPAGLLTTHSHWSDCKRLQPKPAQSIGCLKDLPGQVLSQITWPQAGLAQTGMWYLQSDVDYSRGSAPVALKCHYF